MPRYVARRETAMKSQGAQKDWGFGRQMKLSAEDTERLQGDLRKMYRPRTIKAAGRGSEMYVGGKNQQKTWETQNNKKKAKKTQVQMHWKQTSLYPCLTRDMSTSSQFRWTKRTEILMKKQKNHPEGSTETSYTCVTVLGYKSDSTNSADCFAIQC